MNARFVLAAVLGLLVVLGFTALFSQPALYCPLNQPLADNDSAWYVEAVESVVGLGLAFAFVALAQRIATPIRTRAIWFGLFLGFCAYYVYAQGTIRMTFGIFCDNDATPMTIFLETVPPMVLMGLGYCLGALAFRLVRDLK